MAQLNANLSDYEVQEGFDLLPPGWYPAEIIDSEIKTSKTGNLYVVWVFQVLSHPNRIWHNTALGNDVAMKILKTMATCCGHRNPNYIADTEELHGRRCLIKVKIKKDPEGNYEDKNEISAFKPLDKTQAQVSQPAAATVVPSIPPPHIAAAAMQGGNCGQQPAAAKPKMPWEQ